MIRKIFGFLLLAFVSFISLLCFRILSDEGTLIAFEGTLVLVMIFYMFTFLHPVKAHDIINPYLILFLLIDIAAVFIVIIDSLDIQTTPELKLIYWSEKQHPLLFITLVLSLITTFLTFRMKTNYLFYPVTKVFIYCCCVIFIIIYVILKNIIVIEPFRG